MGIFQRLNIERGITIILITHEMDIAEYVHWLVRFRRREDSGRRANQESPGRAEELAALPRRRNRSAYRAGRSGAGSHRRGRVGDIMSILMTLVIALKALNRNKMRTILTMLGMIIGVGAVITMVEAPAALSRPSRSRSRRPYQHDQHQRRQFSQGGVRQGQGNSTTLVADDAVAIGQLPGVQRSGGRQQSRAGHRREPELVTQIQGPKSTSR
jgi:hypothetical protein